VKRSFQRRDWGGLCVGVRVGRVLRELLPLRGGEKRSDGFFRDARMRMGLTRGRRAENKLTCGVEFPILPLLVVAREQMYLSFRAITFGRHFGLLLALY
jgi:hypothetical protein